ncbi:MAG TPA: Rid family detoxifying hydrolase [Ilumatobacteraceae bacterium]|jgi:2-iminobutanoate/2-iminopropanoate deaminase
MPRHAFNAPNAASVGSYSHAIEIDGFVYLSGQTPLDPSTTEIGGTSIAAQTRQCFANLFAVLAEAGLTSDDVIKCNTYLTDMRDFAEYDAEYRTHFAEPFPARTTVAVAALPRGAQIEIEMIAHR